MALDHLFRPLSIGGLTVKNRIMQLATTNNLDDRGAVGVDQIAFYVERAKGGVGIIVSEGLAAHGANDQTQATSLGRGRIAAHSEGTLAGLTELARAVHEQDVPIIGQIYHGGRQHHSDAIPLLWGPSAVPDPHSGGVPHEMSIDEIEAMITGFGDAAHLLYRAGFDGVEVHAAQGHLIQEFFSPFSNVRADAYGGSFENRIRFVSEILAEVRQRCGADFVVGLRMGAEELSPDGIDESMAVEFAQHIAGLGLIDYLSVTVGNFNSIEIHTPDRHHARMEFVHYAASIRKVVGDLPVVACGRIVEPADADELVARGGADLIGLCRPLLADAEWAAKARAGRVDEIRLCISCNQCWGTIIMERRVNCIQNAATGREATWGIGTMRPATNPKRVVVIGAGPAGLEASRVAAERGHRVLLFEAADETGGSVNLAASIPGHEETRYVVDYLRHATRRAGVEVRTGVEVGADAILAESPDAVIVATGAVPRRDGLGDTGPIPVYTSHDIARRMVELAGRRVVLFDEDGYYQAAEIAELIARTASALTMATLFWEVGREIPATSRVTTLRTLDQLGVTLLPTTWFAAVDGRDVVLEHCLSGRTSRVEAVDAIVHIGLSATRSDLGKALRGRVAELDVIGDAYMPRRIADAVFEGHRAGRAV